MTTSDPDTSVGDTRWCFQCGTEYSAEVEQCVECAVGLVDRPPQDIHDVGTAGEAQLAYELHDWAYEARRMLDQVLTAEDIQHAWQGAALIVREADEEQIDQLVDQVQRSTLPSLDAEKEKVGYELDGWPTDRQTALTEAFSRAGIPHEFDEEGDLVVHAEDEEAADELIEETATAEEDEDLVEMDGLDLHDLLTEVFVACSKLRRDARDPDAAVAVATHAPTFDGIRAPFGVNRSDWKQICVSVTELHDLVADETSDASDVTEHASALHGVLHRML